MSSLLLTIIFFPVTHSVTLLAGAIAVGAAIWHQTRRAWKKRADESQTAMWHAQGEVHEARMYNQQLIAKQEYYWRQLDYWLKPGNCLEKGWVIAGIKKVRRCSWYEQDEITESQEPLGTKNNVFEPVAPPPPKLSLTETDYEPALLLTKNTEAGKFKIVVFLPAEIDRFPCGSLAEVDVEPAAYGWSFDIPRSVRGTGALSFAFDYLLTRAKKEGIANLTAPLTHIYTEAHRIRLRRFYVEKYGFTYVPSLTNLNGYITKKLG